MNSKTGTFKALAASDIGSAGRPSLVGGANTPTMSSTSFPANISNTDFPNADWPIIEILIFLSSTERNKFFRDGVSSLTPLGPSVGLSGLRVNIDSGLQ